MKVARTRNTTAFRRPTPLRRKVSQKAKAQQQQQEENNTENKSHTLDNLSEPLKSGNQSLSDGLAICLFGLTANMYVSENEEEVRKRVIMSVSRESIWEVIE